MQVEFRKVPFDAKDFTVLVNSVTFEGTFCRISSTLAKFDAKLVGNIPVSCCKCGQEFQLNIDEKLDLLVSDGQYNNNDRDEDIIEVDDNIIDFNQLIQSEVSSISSDYYNCDNCKDNDEIFEKEL